MRNIEITENISGNEIIFGLKISENETAISFPEITNNKERAELLCRRLLNDDIAIIHIQDIVRDFIAEESCDKLIANSLL